GWSAVSERAWGWGGSRGPSQRDTSPRTRFTVRLNSCMGALLLGGDAELAHLLLQVLAVHAELLGGARDVPAVATERLGQEVALERLDDALLRLAEGAGRGVRGRLGHGRRAPEQVGGGDLGSRGEEERLLDRRAQLAHVPLPLMEETVAERVAGERLHVAPEALRRVLQEVIDEERDVLAPLRERRDHELDDAQPVVEVLAEAPRVDGGL